MVKLRGVSESRSASYESAQGLKIGGHYSTAWLLCNVHLFSLKILNEETNQTHAG